MAADRRQIRQVQSDGRQVVVVDEANTARDLECAIGVAETKR
jgi:hypothetical protein